MNAKTNETILANQVWPHSWLLGISHQSVSACQGLEAFQRLHSSVTLSVLYTEVLRKTEK